MQTHISKQIILWYLLLSGVTACVNLPVEKSFRNSPDYDINKYSGYDYNAKLRWKVSTDSSSLYIIMDTYESSTMRKIINTGIKIYFDTSGTGDNKCFLSCRGTDILSPAINPSLATGIISQSTDSLSINPNHGKVLASFKEATWHDGQSEVTYDLIFEKTNLVCQYTVDTTGVFICKIRLPVEMINHKKYKPLKKIALGIEIGSLRNNKKENTDENYSPGNQNQGYNRYGNGNKMSLGSGNGRMGNYRKGMNESNSENIQDRINIWFMVIPDSTVIYKPN